MQLYVAGKVAKREASRGAPHRAGGDSDLATGSQGDEPGHGDSPRSQPATAAGASSSGPGLGAAFVCVILLAVVIWIIAGDIAEGVLFGLLLLLIVGAIYPPIAIGFGSVVLVYLVVTNLKKVSSWFGNITSIKPVPGSTAFDVIGPSLPGYTYPSPATPGFSSSGQTDKLIPPGI